MLPGKHSSFYIIFVHKIFTLEFGTNVNVFVVSECTHIALVTLTVGVSGQVVGAPVFEDLGQAWGCNGQVTPAGQ